VRVRLQITACQLPQPGRKVHLLLRAQLLRRLAHVGEIEIVLARDRDVVWRRGMRLDILSVWNPAAFIENRTAGQKTNTAPVSNMTNTRSLTCQSAFTEQEATSRRLMNCLGWMRSRLPRRASLTTKA
jgi:hypothetical protein